LPGIGGAVFTLDTFPLVRLKLKACTTAEPKLGTITKPSDEAEYELLHATSVAIASRTSTASTQAHLLDILRFISMFSCLHSAASWPAGSGSPKMAEISILLFIRKAQEEQTPPLQIGA
jgi:hypothetical protein